MEDFVEYKIYNAQLLNVSQNAKQGRMKVIEFGQSLMDHINKLSNDYLWRKDCFYIEPQFINNGASGARINKLSCFKGILYYGGDINDEWFIVYLLYQISRINKNIVIELTDNDGQFLLIHCAYHLPKWIDPKNAVNRIYIHQNKLHLIPLIHDVINNKPKSIDLILNDSINTLGNNNIQNVIDSKLKQFGHKIYENPGINYHSSIVVLPKQCANIIDKYPFIISYIVDSFINDNTNNKQQKQIKMKQRKFDLDYNDYVFISVRFTRYLYGILSSKPLKSAPMYFRKKKFDIKQYENKHKFNKTIIKNAFLNGIKLMIGFELFYEKCLENIKNDNIDREWIKFKKSLIKKGYFNDCIPSSDSYKKKELNAKQYYNQNMKKPKEYKEEEETLCVINGIYPDNVSSFYLNLIDNEYNKNNNDWIKVYDDSKSNVLFNNLKHDKEDWMNISKTDLNELLNEYQYENHEEHQQMLFEEMLNDDDYDDDDDDDDDDNNNNNKDEVVQQTKDDILSLKESLNTFMDKKSSVHGVEIENENDDNMDNDGLQFDAETVLNILKEEQYKKNDMEQNAMKDMMNEMDDELLMKQKERENKIKEEQGYDNKEDDDDEEEEDLNVDLNIVNDILQSHITSQTSGNGLGPAATLLSQMGIKLK